MKQDGCWMIPIAFMTFLLNLLNSRLFLVILGTNIPKRSKDILLAPAISHNRLRLGYKGLLYRDEAFFSVLSFRVSLATFIALTCCWQLCILFLP